MPLAIKKFLILLIPIILTSSFSGCIFEDIFGGTNFSLNGFVISDDEFFPSLSINFTCSDTVTVKVFGAGNRIVDSDLFFRGNHETDLYLDEFRNTISPGSYKIKAYDKDGNEIYSKSVSFSGLDLEILSCIQKWWKQNIALNSFSLFGLKINVYNNGDVPVYPYYIQVIMDDKITTGLIFPSVVMPKESKSIECFIFRDKVPNNSSFTLNLKGIDENILATRSLDVNTNNNVLTKEFSWNYLGPHKVNIPNPEYLYNYHSSLERTNNNDYSLYVFDPYDDEYIDIILDMIMADYTGTDVQKINYIASFVQTIEYKSDSDNDTQYEYPRFPVETLFDGRGDCEDKAILTASMLYSLGYDIALLRLPNHMAVGVRLSEEDIPIYDYYIEDYYFLETTTKGKTCGFIPHEYKENNDSVTIYPITDRPLLMHNWKDGTITIYTNTEIGDFVSVKTIVENLGKTTARDVLVEGVFVTANGFKINYENNIISFLEPGNKKKVSLIVDIPNSITTYFKTRIYLDDEIVDEQESVSSFP